MKSGILKNAGKTARMRAVAGIGGFLATVLSLGLSIYQSRNADIVAHVAPGTRVDANRWGVTPHSARIAREMPDGSRIADGKRALVLDLTLENLSSESSNVYGDALTLLNIADPPRPQFFLVRDRDILSDLQPAMPEEVKVVWEIPAAQAVPPSLDVAIIGATYKRKDNLYAAPGWFPGTEVARTSLPFELPQAEGAP